MRILHTADWHLGRLFHGRHLTEDQAHVLEQLVGHVASRQPDVVVIAGDVYDRAVPPPEAVQLLDKTLARLVLDLRVPVLLIAGNHDSPDRLGFAGGILREARLHVVGPLSPTPYFVTLEDQYGPVQFFLVPYADPPLVRDRLGDPAVTDHAAAMRRLMVDVHAARKPGARTVLVGHAYAAGGSASDSERPLSIGLAGTVDPACFEGMDYVALGHLHRTQRVKRDAVRYSGSLMKYSFSEANQEKVALLIEMDDAGACTIEHLPLRPALDLRVLEGSLAELLSQPMSDEDTRHYYQMVLTDPVQPVEAMARLKERFPNTLHVRRPERSDDGVVRSLGTEIHDLDIHALFQEFLEAVTGKPPEPQMTETFRRIMDEWDAAQRAPVGPAVLPGLELEN